ncbi:hypothetical protein P3W45_000113 [Vairimorpha bombi]|jgi:hypothetical protein
MSQKRVLDFVETVDSLNVIDLENEEVKKLLPNGTKDIYDIFSSIYHTKLDTVNSYSNPSFSDGTKLNKFVEEEEVFSCVYCGNTHDSSDCTQVICKKCGTQGHTTKRCSNPFNSKKSIRCKKCDFSTHTEFDCPAVYRKYKINRKIDPEFLIKSCAYCAGPHFSDDCDSSLESNKFSVFSEKYIDHVIKHSKK